MAYTVLSMTLFEREVEVVEGASAWVCEAAAEGVDVEWERWD